MDSLRVKLLEQYYEALNKLVWTDSHAMKRKAFNVAKQRYYDFEYLETCQR